MTNGEALRSLEAKRDVVNSALDGLRKYMIDSDNWKTAVATAKMTQIKSDATTAGVDLSTWDGSKA